MNFNAALEKFWTEEARRAAAEARRRVSQLHDKLRELTPYAMAAAPLALAGAAYGAKAIAERHGAHLTSLDPLIHAQMARAKDARTRAEFHFNAAMSHVERMTDALEQKDDPGDLSSVKNAGMTHARAGGHFADAAAAYKAGNVEEGDRHYHRGTREFAKLPESRRHLHTIKRRMDFHEARMDLLKQRTDLLKQWTEAARAAALLARHMAQHGGTATGSLYARQVPEKAAALLRDYSSLHSVPNLPANSIEAAAMSALHSMHADYHAKKALTEINKPFHEMHSGMHRGMRSFYEAEAMRNAVR